MRCGLLHERKQNHLLCGAVKFLCHLGGVGYKKKMEQANWPSLTGAQLPQILVILKVIMSSSGPGFTTLHPDR